MPLRGTVANYGLADVLQLVAQGARSGRLRIERGSDRIDVMLDAGTIVGVETGVLPDSALGSRLVQAGVLTDELLGHALAEQARSGLSIGHFLTRAGHLDPSVLRRQATLHRWDSVMAPFTWNEGQYALEDVAVTVGDEWADPIPVERLLIKGLRLVEEWPRAVAQVPSRRWIVARRVPLPPMTPASNPLTAGLMNGGGLSFEVDVLLEPGSASAGVVSDEARIVHRLAAPGARIALIVGRSPFDAFETVLALSELTEGGFVVLSPP